MRGRKMCIMFSVAKATQNYMRGYGAAGSAPAWPAGGQGFESPSLHYFPSGPKGLGGILLFF